MLVVDDEWEARETVSELLRCSGYTPIPAADGQEALRVLRSMEELPCVILLDLSMPVMNGIEFRMAQVEDVELKAIPVIIASAEKDTGDRVAELGAAAYLRKPVELSVLLSAVKAACDP